jgi:hypothetical protein
MPTITINIPLNNKLQTLDVDAMTETVQKTARKELEPMELNQDGLGEPGICPANNTTNRTLSSAVGASSQPNWALQPTR